jgi:hypothetical protein
VTSFATVVADVSLVVPVLLGVFVRSAPITLPLHVFDIRTAVLLRFVIARVTVLTGKTPDSAVMTTRAGKYH